MPNQGNKSKPDTGIVKKKRKPTVPATDKQGGEGTAAKSSNVRRGDKGSSDKKGSKTSSGDSTGN